MEHDRYRFLRPHESVRSAGRNGQAGEQNKFLGRVPVIGLEAGGAAQAAEATLVVVVDGDSGSRSEIGAQLRDQGYDTIEVSNGIDALEKITSRADLVLLDMTIAGPDCVELTRRLKENPGTRNILIVGLAGTDSEKAQERMLEAGADDFVQKGASRFELYIRIRNLVGLRGSLRKLAEKNASLSSLLDKRTRELTRADYLLSRTLDALPAHIAIIDSSGTIIAVNDAWRQFARDNGGDTETFHVGEPYLQMDDEDQRELWQERFDRLMNWQADVVSIEYDCSSATESRWFQVNLSALQAGSATYVAVVHHDITERRQAELALQESEKTFRTLVVTAPALISMIARSGDVLFTNATKPDGELQLHREPPHSSAFDYLAPEFRQLMEGAMDRAEVSRQIQSYEALALMPSGQQKWTQSFVRHMQGTGAQAQFLFYTSDISARRATEVELEQSRMQLHQSQKLEAIGALAGGVAHDFNNLLTIIMSSCAQLVDEDGRGEQHRKSVDDILRATERAASLTGQLLTFARDQPLEVSVFDLERNLRSIQPLLRRTIRENVDFVMRLSGSEARIAASASQIDQVVVNLVVNARDAMPNGGRLEIVCDVLEELDTADGHGKQSWVQLTVEDTGLGMDAATQSRIFDPFYSTKLRGEGTGLGLATCYGIVAGAGGSIAVESQLGHGTTFTIRLPLSSKPLDMLDLDEANPASLAGDEVVLIVEDDRDIRRMLRSTFEAAGYEVIVARHGEEALKEFAAAAQEIDLLVSDVLLPGISGFEVAAALLETQPDLPVLLATGYVGDAAQNRVRLPSDIPVMRKPFTGRQVLREARKLLDAPPRVPQNSGEPLRDLESKPRQPVVLIIDDERALRVAFTRMLSSDYAVISAESASEAMKIIESGSTIDVILCDLQLGETSGISLFEVLQAHHERLAERSLFITGGATSDESGDFIRRHADRIIRKPTTPAIVRERIKRLLES